MPEPRTLIWDVENSPSLGWYYDRFTKSGSNIIADKQDWRMLSFAYRWLGEDKTHVRALPDYPGYRRDRTNDRRLVEDLRNIISEADITVAHNGRAHDHPKLAARLIYHSLPPPRRGKDVDTYLAAKKYAKFTSNSLAHLASHLGIDPRGKLPHTGFDLWRRCMDEWHTDVEAWATMREYNRHDVDILEGVYLRLRPFMTNHPNLTWISGDVACPVCQSPKLHKDGFEYLRTGKRQRMSCCKCGYKFKMGSLIKDAA